VRAVGGIVNVAGGGALIARRGRSPDDRNSLARSATSPLMSHRDRPRWVGLRGGDPEDDRRGYHV